MEKQWANAKKAGLLVKFGGGFYAGERAPGSGLGSGIGLGLGSGLGLGLGLRVTVRVSVRVGIAPPSPTPTPHRRSHPRPRPSAILYLLTLPGKIPAPPKEGSTGWVTPAVLSLWALFGK